MISLGNYNTLRITRFTQHGAYLDGGNVGEILMPQKYLNPRMRIGDKVEVFVYLDQGERLVGTLETPLARVGDFAFLRVAWVNEFGAFLDWGLMKDLFVPFREQKMPMQQGRSYLVHIHIDPETQRIVASAKVERYLQRATTGRYHRGQEVEIVIQQKTPLGFKCIADNRCPGQLYDNQIFDVQPHAGDVFTATVVNVRPDGKLDLSLQRIGKGRFRDFAEQLREALQQAGGSLPVSDHSSPEELQQRFGVSKKTFKRAVGTLYKNGELLISPDKITLINED
ncbi:S1-like domain-containing RNA-binding protein [bacterium]|nr:S1-like domain-containing RNA-binding protein [bacterium]